MGLHVTPYGTFYVQRSLRTGEVMQVLPVKRPDMPSHLPSVDSLGITENFIERRRASIAADNARASNSQDRLQRELATAGGERLLETGKAVLSQRDDGSSGSSGSVHGSNTHHSPSAPNHDGDVEMAFSSSTEAAAGPPTAIPDSYQHAQRRQNLTGSNNGRGSNIHDTLNEDLHHQPPPSSMAMAPHMLPVRPWPESLQEPMVNLPPFREIDSARALSQEEELRHEERISRGGINSNSRRRKSTASPRLTSLLRSSSRSSSRSNSTSSMTNSNGSHGSNAFNISSMISHQDSEGSASSTYSASEVSTPAAFSPAPDYYYSNNMLVDGALQPPTPTQRTKSTPRAQGRVNKTRTSPSPRPSPAAAAATTPSVTFPSPSSSSPFAPSQKKAKTVWIIRTLEPRKSTSGQTATGNECHGDYEPQRVKTHVETHVLS